MKRIISLSALLLFAITSMAATITFTIGDFTYSTTTGSSTAKITKYNGADSYVSFPTSVSYEGTTYQITEINNANISIIPSNNSTVEKIFIPSGITTLKTVTKELASLKTVVIEDGTTLQNVYNAFYLNSIRFNNNILDNIIVLSSCSTSPSNFVSSNAEDLLLKAGEIKVYYQEVCETIQMYLYSNLGKMTERKFGTVRFRYLLSALQKGGKDISTISKIDLSQMPNNTNNVNVNFTFDTDNYDPSSELSPGAIVVTNTKSYTAPGTRTTTITDKENFTAPQYSILTDITYNRSNTLKWNSVCLPFDIKESDFGNDVCKIYIVTAATDQQINLTRVESTETLVKAGTPCFIYSNASEWTLSLANATIRNDVAAKTLPVGVNWQVVGSFTNETIGSGKYKLNSSGTEFGITNSDAATVTAFRCYLNYTGSQGAPNRLSVNIDEEASITLVPNDAEPQEVKLYDLMGRPRKKGSQGIFIKSKR